MPLPPTPSIRADRLPQIDADSLQQVDPGGLPQVAQMRPVDAEESTRQP